MCIKLRHVYKTNTLLSNLNKCMKKISKSIKFYIYKRIIIKKKQSYMIFF